MHLLLATGPLGEDTKGDEAAWDVVIMLKGLLTYIHKCYVNISIRSWWRSGKVKRRVNIGLITFISGPNI